MPSAARAERFAARLVAEIAVASMGGVLVACALGADQRWFDRHFLPAFFVSRRVYVLVETSVRVLAAASGTTLAVIARPGIGRVVGRSPTGALHMAVAVVLAFAASELTLRQTHLRAAEEQPTTQEPRRRLDPRLGWNIVPGRAGHHVKNGRDIQYTFDAAGYRVRRVDEPVDPNRPTIVFTGESMMLGEGLTWDETIPAQTGALMGLQSANLAVSGFASDQAYLRLQAELPHFRRPVAVVTLFAPALFDRNLNDDRPHLGPGLAWQPAAERWRLVSIARLLVRYRSLDAIERGITITREVLRATIDLAHARGAVPLIVVPQFLPEDPTEQALRHRILDGAAVPYLQVELDPRWRISGDGHPDPRGAHDIAASIATRLRER